MNEVDDILGIKENSNYKNNSYSNNYSHQYNNNWKEQQNKDRQEAYDTMERKALDIVANGNEFQQYLNIQSRFEKYSVGNCLIVLANNPNAKLFRDKKSWNDKRVDLVQNPKSIKILEPSRANNNKVYYNPKEVYDISQTNAPKVDTINYDKKQLLQAFIYNCIAEREVVDVLPNGTIGAEYVKEENKLYACRGMEIETLCQTISQEVANIEMREREDSSLKSFEAYCISYMLCKKYGIDVSNYQFTNLPNELKNMNIGKEIRAEIDNVRVNFETINSRITEYFEKSMPERKNTTPER